MCRLARYLRNDLTDHRPRDRTDKLLLSQLNQVVLMRLHLLLVGSLLCTIGCNSVTIDKPLGSPVDESVLNTWRGTYLTEENDVILIERGPNKDLIIGHTTWDADQQQFQCESLRVELRTIGNKTLLYLPSEQEKRDNWTFLWVTKAEHSLTIRSCKPQSFLEAVEAGTLQGTIERRGNKQFDVRLAAGKTLEAFLDSPDAEQCFEPANKVPFKRFSTQVSSSD